MALLQVLEDRDRLVEDEAVVLEHRHLPERIQPPELRRRERAAREIDDDLLAGEPLLAERDPDASGKDRERVPVEAHAAVTESAASRDGRRARSTSSPPDAGCGPPASATAGGRAPPPCTSRPCGSRDRRRRRSPCPRRRAPRRCTRLSASSRSAGTPSRSDRGTACS